MGINTSGDGTWGLRLIWNAWFLVLTPCPVPVLRRHAVWEAAASGGLGCPTPAIAWDTWTEFQIGSVSAVGGM